MTVELNSKYNEDLSMLDISIADLKQFPDMKDVWQSVKDHIRAEDDSEVIGMCVTDEEPDEMWEPEQYFTSIDKSKELNPESPDMTHGVVVFGTIMYNGNVVHAVYLQDASPAVILLKHYPKETI
jgi:hypothetical protein